MEARPTDNSGPRKRAILRSALAWTAATLLAITLTLVVPLKGTVGSSFAIVAWAAAALLTFLTVVVIRLALIQDKAIETLERSFQDLQREVKRVGGLILNIRWLAADPDDRSGVYDNARKLVCEARESITVLTSYLLDSDPRAGLERAKRDYFAAILRHVEAQARINPRFRYRRVVQCKERSDLKLFAKDGPYRDHILDMESARRRGLPAYVTVVEHARPTTFVIVDGREMLWQINSVQVPGRGGTSDLLTTEGSFRITDASGAIIPHHQKAFDDIAAKGGPPTEEELEFLRQAKDRSVEASP